MAPSSWDGKLSQRWATQRYRTQSRWSLATPPWSKCSLEITWKYLLYICIYIIGNPKSEIVLTPMIPMGSSTKYGYGKQLSSMAVLVVDIPLSAHIIAYHGYPSVISKIGKGCSFSCRCTSDSPGMSRSHRFVLCAVRCVASSFPGFLSHWGTETTVVATRSPIWSSQPPRRLSQRDDDDEDEDDDDDGDDDDEDEERWWWWAWWWWRWWWLWWWWWWMMMDCRWWMMILST